MDEVPPIDAKQEFHLATQQLSEKAQRAANDLLHGDFQSSYQFLHSLIVPTVSAFVTLVVVYFLGKYISKAVSLPINRRVDETLGKFVEKLTFRSIVGCGILFVLSQFGIRSTSFAAVIAAAGFAIGLAFQGTLSNFASGILLMVFRPFKVGDVVVAAGVNGKVHEIDLFTTVIDTTDNRRIIVPNSSVAGNTIENVTFHQYRRIEVSVGIEYRADLDESREVLTRATESIRDVTYQDEHRTPQVILNGLGASSVDWLVRVWAPTVEFGDVRDRLIYAIKTHLDVSSIGIAFPQMDLHLDSQALESLKGNATTPNRVRPRLNRVLAETDLKVSN